MNNARREGGRKSLCIAEEQAEPQWPDFAKIPDSLLLIPLFPQLKKKMKFEAILNCHRLFSWWLGSKVFRAGLCGPTMPPPPTPECPAGLQVPFTLSDLLACYQISRAWSHPTGFNCLHFIPGGSSLNNHLNSRSRAVLGPIQSVLLLGSSTASVANQLRICGPAPPPSGPPPMTEGLPWFLDFQLEHPGVLGSG